MNVICPHCGRAQAAGNTPPGQGVSCAACGTQFDPPSQPGTPPLPPSAEEVAARRDQVHLNLLRMFFLMAGLFTGVVSSAWAMYVWMSIRFAELADLPDNRLPFPVPLGGVFTVLGVVFLLWGWTLGFLMICTGKYLRERRRHRFCFVVACLCCLSGPCGMALGILTILVLSRPSVKKMFQSASSGEDASP